MKTFFLKTMIFCFLVAGGQTLIARPLTVPSQIEFLDMFLGLQAEIVYLGDSTLNAIAPQDKFRLSMPGMLERLVRPYGVVDVSGPHYQPGLYQSYCRYIVRQKDKPRFVILPVNLRVFSAEWSRNPAYRFEELKLILAIKGTFWERFYRPLSVFKAARKELSAADHARAKYGQGPEDAGRLRDLKYFSRGKTPSSDAFRRMLTMRYLSALSIRHSWVKALENTADILLRAGITPVFYVSPVDVQTGEEYFGQEFSAAVARNISVLRASLKKEGVYFLDLSRSLRTSDFCWPEDGSAYPDERLKFEGRMFVVENIAGVVKSWHPSAKK